MNKLPSSPVELPSSLPYTDDLSPLSRPLRIGSRTAANRFLYQPMEGCDGTPEGAPDELTVRRYRRFAAGGAGIIWFEACAVLPEGRANPRQLFMCERNLGALSSLVGRVKEICVRENGFEPLVICQLTHSGRYSKPHGVPEPVIAYNNPLFEGKNPIPASAVISDDELARVGEALTEGAKLAFRAGFDGADIKSCHRYLLSELLSAYNRPGNYGGSFDNRTRLLTDTVAAARSVCDKDFIITTRFNLYDGFPYPYGFGVNPYGIAENRDEIGVNPDGIAENRDEIGKNPGCTGEYHCGTVKNPGYTDENPGCTAENRDGTPAPDFTEGIELSRRLASLGVPLLNVTMGNPYVNSDVNRPAAASSDPLAAVSRLLDGAAAVAGALPSVAVACSGLSFLGVTSANVAAACIEENRFALAGYGRETLAYPDIARDILRYGRADPRKLCIACGKCTELMRAGKTPGCVIRDREVYTPLYASLRNR